MLKMFILLLSSVCLYNGNDMATISDNTYIVNQSNEINNEEIIPIYNIPLSEEYQIFTYNACKYYNLDYETTLIQMYVESSYNSIAVSYANCIGLLQASPQYCSSYYTYNDEYDKYIINSNYDLYDIKTNIVISLRELSFWRDECNKRGLYNISDYLNCYNRGYLYFKDNNHEYSDMILSKSIYDIENYYK